MGFIEILEAGRRDFLDATSDISQEQACVKPGKAGWSVLECIEHVVTVEDRYLGWIINGAAIEPQRDPEKELRLFTIIRSRLTKVEAPAAVRPHGRFDSLSAALAGFSEVRDRSARTVEEFGGRLYSIGARHPFFGNVNGAELVQLMDGHARRHADQIREIREGITMA